jgi:hypothetical protein
MARRAVVGEVREGTRESLGCPGDGVLRLARIPWDRQVPQAPSHERLHAGGLVVCAEAVAKQVSDAPHSQAEAEAQNGQHDLG